jgi:hypothetical protein
LAGFIIGIALYVVSLLRGTHHHLKQASLVVLVGVALVAIPTYVTGNAAERALQNTQGVSPVLMSMHEGAAFIALMLMQVTGFFAWLALWQLRRFSFVPRWASVLVLLLALATLALVARAANLGGEIRHPEIRVTQDATTEQIGRVVGDFIRDTRWAWPASETLHFIGLTLLMGVLLLVNLRVLAFIRGIPMFLFVHTLGMSIVAGAAPSSTLRCSGSGPRARVSARWNVCSPRSGSASG